MYPLREITEGNVDISTYPVSIHSSKVTVRSAPFVRVQPLTEQKFSEMSSVSPSQSPSPVEGSGCPSSRGSGCRGESGQRDEVGLAGGEPRHLLDEHDESGRGGGAET